MPPCLRNPVTALDFALYFDLRWRILREPWTTDRESGKDEQEEHAIHLMAFEGDQLAGVGRVHLNNPREAQIRYMAVEKNFTGRGIGSLILAALEQDAIRMGAENVVLNARSEAATFYKARGYGVLGVADKLFDSIEHWRMGKSLRFEPSNIS